MTQAYPAVPLPGSRRDPVPGAVRVADAAPDEPVFATLVLRRRTSQPGEPGQAGAPADPDDVQDVRTFAAAAGLDVAGVNLAARSVRLRGTAAAMAAAFGVDLGAYETVFLRYRGREGSIYLPEELDGVVVAVLGLDNRPTAQAHFRIAGAPGRVAAAARPAAARRPAAGEPPDDAAPALVPTGYSPRDIAAAYGFPTDIDGSGQTVAIIELGGGFRTNDLDTYFNGLGLPTPAVEAAAVDGAANAPGADADGEVMLDIEVIGAVAPGVTMAVYFGPNTTDGFYDAIAAAVHDNARRPSVISISWGQAEAGWTPSQLDAYEELFADAAAAGISVYVAAGDNGATDGDNDGGLHVDFPASSPSVVGCGGTTLTLIGTTVSDEVVWNELSSDDGATGGGISSHFSTPAYQTSAGLPDIGRGVPDIAGNADPFTGYTVRIDGQNQIIGGTSAVAPLWTALTALANQRNGAPVGAPHASLYTTPTALRDITVGDNGGYLAAAGWDACTGLGTPHGDLVIAAFASVAAGGRPVSVPSVPVASDPAMLAPLQPAPGLVGGPEDADSGPSPNEFSW
jgi:kumamolisin